MARSYQDNRLTRRWLPCGACGTPFLGERWKRLCPACWRVEHDRALQEEAYRRGYRDGLLAARNRVLLDAATLAAAIGLTHPDRHPPERFQVANAVTAQLLTVGGDRS